MPPSSSSFSSSLSSPSRSISAAQSRAALAPRSTSKSAAIGKTMCATSCTTLTRQVVHVLGPVRTALRQLTESVCFRNGFSPTVSKWTIAASSVSSTCRSTFGASSRRQTDSASKTRRLEQTVHLIYEYCKFSPVFSSQIGAIFRTMFELDESFGEIKVNDKFKVKIQKWLNNDPALTSQALKQVRPLTVSLLATSRCPSLSWGPFNRKSSSSTTATCTRRPSTTRCEARDRRLSSRARPRPSNYGAMLLNQLRLTCLTQPAFSKLSRTPQGQHEGLRLLRRSL